MALDHWDTLGGEAVARNLPNLARMDLMRMTQFVWWRLTKDQDHNEMEKLKARLWQPPPGEVGQGPWSPEAETSAFSALKSALG